MRTRSDRGGALLVALIAALLLGAIGVGLVRMTTTERAIAGNFQDAHQGRLAAEAVLERALADLRRFDASALLSGTVNSSFTDTSRTPVGPWGAPIDLIAMTAALQARSDAAFGWSANNTRWRLLLYGPFANLVTAVRSPLYVAAWVGDDLSETDGDPHVDTNQSVVVLAHAFGPSGLRFSVRAAVAIDGGVRVLSWKEAAW